MTRERRNDDNPTVSGGLSSRIVCCVNLSRVFFKALSFF